jgi:hypothetical protein
LPAREESLSPVDLGVRGVCDEAAETSRGGAFTYRVRLPDTSPIHGTILLEVRSACSGPPRRHEVQVVTAPRPSVEIRPR